MRTVSKVIHHCEEAIQQGSFLPNGWSACGGLYPKRTTVKIDNVTCAKCLRWYKKRMEKKKKK